jgi:hypothetical protein
MGSPGRGVAGAKNDLKNLLNKFDDFSFVKNGRNLACY